MQNKKFGALSSSVDENEISLTITNIAKLVGTVLSALVALQGANAVITNTEVELVVAAIVMGGTGIVSVYQGGQIVWGILRKFIVKYYA